MLHQTWLCEERNKLSSWISIRLKQCCQSVYASHRFYRSRKKEMRKSNWNEKFTIIELLIVVAIIAILASMLLPALNRARGKAVEINCINSLKELVLSGLHYANDHDDFLPLVGNRIVGEERDRPQYLLVDMKYASKEVVKKGCRTERIAITGVNNYMDSVWASPFFYNGFLGYIQADGNILTQGGKLCKPVKTGSVVKPSHKVLWGDAKKWNNIFVHALKGHGTVEAENMSTWTVSFFCHGKRMNLGFVDGHAQSVSHGEIGKINADIAPSSTQYWLHPDYTGNKE